MVDILSDLVRSQDPQRELQPRRPRWPRQLHAHVPEVRVVRRLFCSILDIFGIASKTLNKVLLPYDDLAAAIGQFVCIPGKTVGAAQRFS
jgi:hypothetical protein